MLLLIPPGPGCPYLTLTHNSGAKKRDLERASPYLEINDAQSDYICRWRS